MPATSPSARRTRSASASAVPPGARTSSHDEHPLHPRAAKACPGGPRWWRSQYSMLKFSRRSGAGICPLLADAGIEARTELAGHRGCEMKPGPRCRPLVHLAMPGLPGKR